MLGRQTKTKEQRATAPQCCSGNLGVQLRGNASVGRHAPRLEGHLHRWSHTTRRTYKAQQQSPWDTCGAHVIDAGAWKLGATHVATWWRATPTALPSARRHTRHARLAGRAGGAPGARSYACFPELELRATGPNRAMQVRRARRPVDLIGPWWLLHVSLERAQTSAPQAHPA